MAVNPADGTVFVGTRGSKVFAVSDRNRDGVADPVGELAPALSLNTPNGVCFAADGSLFVVELNRVLNFAAAELALGRADPVASVVVPQGQLIPVSEESRNHSARACAVGPDGRLYIAIGQPYNVPPPQKAELYWRWGIGGIVRFRREGSEREVYARGVRNSVGLAFNPKDGSLWFTDNQVDGMGDDIPPGELNRATRAGQHFGFPWYGGGRVRTTEYLGSVPPADALFPEVEMDAHAADLGLMFYRGSQFPLRYRGGIFSAQHGSWNRTEPIGARVMFTPLRSDGTAGAPEVFAAGWLTARGDYLGRPVDVQELGDGSILVSDDFAGAIYRISYRAP